MLRDHVKQLAEEGDLHSQELAAQVTDIDNHMNDTEERIAKMDQYVNTLEAHIQAKPGGP